MTFADFREYVAGDDVRNISWILTARTGKTYIKQFEEERELTLILAVDISGSSDFGTGDYFKGETMVHLAALLSYAASRNNDHVGLLLFSDQVEHFVPPKKGRGHIQRIMRDLYYFKPQHRGTKISSGLEYLQGILKKRSNIFLFSDFMDQNFESSLKLLGNKHDVVAVVVGDQAEYFLPEMGVVDLHDAETGEVITVDTSSKEFRNQYESLMREKKVERDRLLRKAQVERLDISSNEDFVDPLIRFFQQRKKR